MKLWNKNFSIIFLVNLFASSSYYMLSTSISTYLDSLNYSKAQIGYIIGIFTITTLLIRPFSGYLTDRKSKKSIVTVGVLLVTIAIVGYGTRITFGWLIFCRLLHGLGWGFYTTSSITMASEYIPEPRLSEGIAIYGLGQVLTMAIVPGMAAVIFQRWSYSSVIWLCAGLSLCTLLLSFICGESNTPDLTLTGSRFQLFERSALVPAIIAFLIGSVYSAISSFMFLYGEEQGIKGIEAFFTVNACALLLSRTFGGKISDRMGWQYVVLPGIGSALVCVLLLGNAKSLIWDLAAAVFWGVGFGGIQPNLQALVVKKAAPERRGAALGTYTMGFDAGVGLGASLAGVASASLGYAGMFRQCVWPLLLALLVSGLQLKIAEKRKNNEQKEEVKHEL